MCEFCFPLKVSKLCQRKAQHLRRTTSGGTWWVTAGCGAMWLFWFVLPKAELCFNRWMSCRCSVTHVYREFRFFWGDLHFINVLYKPPASVSGVANGYPPPWPFEMHGYSGKKHPIAKHPLLINQIGLPNTIDAQWTYSWTPLKYP